MTNWLKASAGELVSSLLLLSCSCCYWWWWWWRRCTSSTSSFHCCRRWPGSRVHAQVQQMTFDDPRQARVDLTGGQGQGQLDGAAFKADVDMATTTTWRKIKIKVQPSCRWECLASMCNRFVINIIIIIIICSSMLLAVMLTNLELQVPTCYNT